MKQILLLQSAFAMSVAIFDIPSGYFADAWGKKKILLIGTTLRGLSFSMLPFIHDFNSFLVFEVLYGLSTSFVTGTNVAILYDILDDLKINAISRAKYLGRLTALQMFSESLAAILGGYIARSSFIALAIVAMIVNWIPFVCIYFIKIDFNKLKETVSVKKFLFEIFKIFKFNDKTLSITFINSIIIALFTYSISWSLQKKWSNIGLPIAYFGYVWASYSLISSLGMSLIGLFERTFKVRTITLLSYAVVLLGLYLIQNQNIVIVIGAGILFQFSRIFQISNDNLLYSVTPQSYMSSLGSTISVFFRLGFAIIAPLMGQIIDKWGVDGFFFSTSLVLVFVGILLMIPYYRIIKT